MNPLRINHDPNVCTDKVVTWELLGPVYIPAVPFKDAGLRYAWIVVNQERALS